MPPSNDTGNAPSASTTASRKRSTAGRIVPAIPLSLSKARPTKPRPTPNGNARVDAPAYQTPVQNGELTVKGSPSVSVDQRGHSPLPLSNAEPETFTPDESKPPSVETLSPDDAATPSSPNGHMPDPSDKPATEPRELEPPFSPLSPEPTSSSSAQKPTERSSMRRIRTELPPPFVPAAEQQTPQSDVSSSHHQTFGSFHGHPAHVSTSSIIFGGMDSSTSSPAPPQSSGSVSQVSFLPTPLAYPYIGNGHVHHVSDPHAQRGVAPGYGPPQYPWTARNSHSHHSSQQPWTAPNGNVPFHYPPRQIFTPSELRQSNGRVRSRSGSASQTSRAVEDLQSPTATDGDGRYPRSRYSEPKLAFSSSRHSHHQHHSQPMLPPPTFYPTNSTINTQNTEALRDYLSQQYSFPALADCHLQIVEDESGERHYVEGHKLILARSPMLLALIEKSEPASASLKTQVNIVLKGRHTRIPSFTDGLRFLYGANNLSTLDQLRQHPGNGEGITVNETRMARALEFVAVGSWLNVPLIAEKGLETISGLLHWDTMPSVLSFALEGGLGLAWSVDDGSEEKSSCASSDDSGDNIGDPTYDPFASQLLHRVIDFAVHMFPHDFYLDASASELPTCQRLPPTPSSHESRPSQSDPRLSRIRFGEVPVDELQRPSFVTTTISSMLLSLPFALLKCVLEHYDFTVTLGPETAASIMRQVVAERETRRIRVLKARGPGPQEGDESSLVQNLYWEELVEPSGQHRAGFRLARRKRDIDTPPSSGVNSEDSK